MITWRLNNMLPKTQWVNQFSSVAQSCPTLSDPMGWGIDLDYSDTEWFALETNRDHSVVFETASKYCISDSC